MRIQTCVSSARFLFALIAIAACATAVGQKPAPSVPAVVEYRVLKPVVQTEQRYFLPPVRLQNQTDAPTKFRRADYPGAPDTGTHIQNRIAIKLDLSILAGAGYRFADAADAPLDSPAQPSAEDFILLRGASESDLQKLIIPAAVGSKFANPQAGQLKAGRSQIDTIAKGETDCTLYVKPEWMPTHGVYAIGISLLKPAPSGGYIPVVVFASDNRPGHNPKSAIVLTRFDRFPISISGVEGVDNATLLTYKTKSTDTDKKGSSVRTTLEINESKQSTGIGSFRLTGKEVLSTQPLDTQSQVQFLLDNEGSIDNLSALSEIFFKVGFSSNQIFSNQEVVLHTGYRRSLESYAVPIAHDDICSQSSIVEWEFIGTKKLRRDKRVAGSSPSGEFLVGTRTRFVGLYDKIKSMPLGVEYRLYHFPFKNLHAGYAIHDLEQYVVGFIGIPGTQGKFNVGYEIGLDESTFKRSKGQWIFNVQITY